MSDPWVTCAALARGVAATVRGSWFGATLGLRNDELSATEGLEGGAGEEAVASSEDNEAAEIEDTESNGLTALLEVVALSKRGLKELSGARSKRV